MSSLPEYRNQFREKRKRLLIAMLGCECVWCGSTEDLQFDHIDAATKLFDISQRLDYRLEILEEELKKCQLLCASCHGRKTRQDNYVPHEVAHGTFSEYTNHGCRCDDCRKANAEYASNRRLKALSLRI